MPIQSCTLSGGGSGYRFGKSGHCYPTREGAEKQMRAEFNNGYKGKGALDFAKANGLTPDDLDAFIGDTNTPYMVRAEFAMAKTALAKEMEKSDYGKKNLSPMSAPIVLDDGKKKETTVVDVTKTTL